MPRHLRIHVPGLLYHLVIRGKNGHTLFRGAADYAAFLTALQTTRARYPFALYAYALMPTHCHLLLEVGAAPTGRLMQALLTGYARRFNRVHHRRGPVFQGRYTALVCERDPYLLELVRYLHLNPVRAGLVKRPAEWPWSGHHEYLGTIRRGLIDPGPVRRQFATPAQYEAFVREGLKGGYRAEWHPSQSVPFLGTEKFIRRVTHRRDSPSAPRLPSLATLWRQEATQAGLTPEALRSGGRSRRLVQARDRFMRRAVLGAGYQAVTVANFIGCHASNISRALQKDGD